MKKAMIIILAVVLVLVLVLCGKSCKKEGPAADTTVPETTTSETTVPETTVPETTVPETTVPETTVPETTAPAYPPQVAENQIKCYIGYFDLETGPATTVTITFGAWEEAYKWIAHSGRNLGFATSKQVIKEGEWFKYNYEENEVLNLSKAWDEINSDTVLEIEFITSEGVEYLKGKYAAGTYTTKAGVTYTTLDDYYVLQLGDSDYYVQMKLYNSDHGSGTEFEYLTFDIGTGW